MVVKRRRWPWIGLVVVVLAGVGWRRQSELVAAGAGWYLHRVAAREAASGDLTRRRQIVAGMHRMLLMPPPPDAMVPELFDVVTLVSQRAASGDLSLEWAAYVYTSYYRDMVRDRPTGEPTRDAAAVTAELDRVAKFYSLGKRPDVQGVRLGDLMGGGDGYSLDEIEQADREGRTLPLR